MNAEPPPNNQYRCEARKPGKKPFEFETPDGDSARAMCDAHGWEFIRVYQPGGDADRPAAQPAKGNHPLSQQQIRALAIECKATYQFQKEFGLTDLAETEWRHEQIQSKTGCDGLRQCQNSHYAKLMRHFKRLRGEKTIDAPSGGRQSGEGGDTLQRREQLLALIAHELGSHARRVTKPQDGHETRLSEHAKTKGGAIGEDYLMKIARAKNPGITLHDCGCLLTLTAAKLEHLLFTLRNRIAGREGRGSAGKRNKSQRKKGGQP